MKTNTNTRCGVFVKYCVLVFSIKGNLWQAIDEILSDE